MLRLRPCAANVLLTTLPALLLLACAPDARPPGPVATTDARIRVPVAGSTMTVAYLTLTNTTREPIVLTGVTGAADIEVAMHTHLADGDTLRMRPLARLALPPGDAVRFEPGGHHLMVSGIEDIPGSVEFVLQYADGTRQTVPFRRYRVEDDL